MSGSVETPLWLAKWTHSVLLTENFKPFSWTLFTLLTHNWSCVMTLGNHLPLRLRAKSSRNKEDSESFTQSVMTSLILILKSTGDSMLPWGTQFSWHESSLGRTVTGNFLPPLEAEVDLTGTSVFFYPATSSTISTWLLFAELLPGMFWEAFIGICWGVTVCVPVCFPFTGGAFGRTGLLVFTRVTSIWTEQDTVFLATTDAKRGFAPGSNQELVSRTYLRASGKDNFFSIFTLWISFSVFQTLHFLEDGGFAPLQFMHLEGVEGERWEEGGGGGWCRGPHATGLI